VPTLVDILLLQTVSIVVASTGLLIAAIYYALQIRHQTRIRKTDLVIRLYSTWESKEFTEATLKIWNLEFKDYDDFVKKYGQWYSETEVYTALRMVANFFQVIGILLFSELVDIDMVVSTFGLPIITTWDKVKPLVEGGRKQMGPSLFGNFEHLYNEMKRREQRR
jgi:hypothetical protein